MAVEHLSVPRGCLRQIDRRSALRAELVARSMCLRADGGDRRRRGLGVAVQDRRRELDEGLVDARLLDALRVTTQDREHGVAGVGVGLVRDLGGALLLGDRHQHHRREGVRSVLRMIVLAQAKFARLVAHADDVRVLVHGDRLVAEVRASHAFHLHKEGVEIKVRDDSRP